MTVPSIVKNELAKFLISLAMIFQISACSTEDNINGTGSGIPSGGTGSGISSATLSWAAPAERDDGTGISLSEIAGYRIYYGTTEGVYPNQIDINDGSVYQATLNNLDSGTYYVVVTTIDTDGRESAYSDEVVRTI